MNGDRIRLPSGDVRLSAGELEEVVHVGEDGVAEPVAFRLDLDFGRDVDLLFDAHTDNIFMVKLTYWLGL